MMLYEKIKSSFHVLNIQIVDKLTAVTKRVTKQCKMQKIVFSCDTKLISAHYGHECLNSFSLLKISFSTAGMILEHPSFMWLKNNFEFSLDFLEFKEGQCHT